MATLNKVMLIGNLTRDPETRLTPKGTAICQFSLAINRHFTDESGLARDEVTYVDIEAWGKSADLAQKFLRKGSLAYIEGRLRLDQWKDKQDQPRSRMKVVMENVQFLSQGQRPKENVEPTTVKAPSRQENVSEDVPF